MELTIGEYVVYGTSGICKITKKEKRSFDGIEEKEYYILMPIDSGNSTYYIPIDGIDNKIRKLLSKDEIYTLIDSMPDIEPMWCSDNNERKAMFSLMLKSDDYKKIICMIKSLYSQKQERISNGKKLSCSDEITLNTAENIMYQEFGTVLGMKSDKVKEFILNRLEQQNVE